MSEAAELTLSLPGQAANVEVASHAFDAVYPASMSDKVHSFAFSSRRWMSGLGQAAAAVGFTGVGIGLLTQVASTPALRVQVAILGLLLIAGGIAFGFRAVQELFGRLVLDRSGIHSRPGPLGFSIAWNDLRRWEVREDVPGNSVIPCIRLWQSGESTSCAIPSRLLSDGDRREVWRQLRLRAPHREITIDDVTPPSSGGRTMLGLL